MAERLRAAFELILFYVILPIFSIYAILQAIITSNIILAVFGSVYMALSIYVVLRKVQYDSKILNTIKIDEAPFHLTRLFSETTNRGVLINQLIIKTLAEKSGISQTDLYHELPISAEMCPTKEMVRRYINKLEKEGFIRNIAPQLGEAKKKVYVLTKKGEWSVHAIKKYYPAYYVSFLIRDILRTRFRKKLPSFNSITEE